MKKAKENISGGTAMTIAGAVCIPSGATILALSNGEPLFVGLGTGFLAIGVGFVIAGPILIHQSKKQRNAANELKRTAYLLPPSFNYAYNTKLDSRPSFTASLRIAF
ncbi:hypothetical protein [Methylotenera sp.]|uniref:hypothetical protein n=1 Tax=Methylotenera sp. TaxID=2051956 RepID=UPI002ED7FBDA